MSMVGPSNLKPPVSALVPYASQLIIPQDIDMPDISDELAEVLGDQWKSGFGQIQRAMGYSRPATQETYSYYYDDLYIRKTRITEAISSGTGASGAAFTLDVNANDIYTVGSKKLMYPKPGDYVMFPTQLTGGIKYRAHVDSTSPTTSPPTITLTLADSTQSLPAISANFNLIDFTNAYGEGSGQPIAGLRNINKRSGRLQIIKATMRGTGTEISNGKWFIKGTESGPIPYYYMYGMDQVAYEMSKAEDGALMWGDFTTNPITPLYDGFSIAAETYTTEGLVTAIEKRGQVLPYNIGSFDITDFNAASLSAAGENSGNTFTAFCSKPFLIEMEDVLVDYLKHTDIAYAFGDRAQYVAQIGFQGIRKADVLYMTKELEVLMHPELYAAAGFEDLNNMGIFLPNKKTKGYWEPEERVPAMIPSFGQRFKALDAYNRKFMAWTIDGSGFSPANKQVSEYDVNQLYQRGHIGGEYKAENQMQLWKGAF